MKTKSTIIALSVLAASSIAPVAFAEGLYGSAMLGTSQQETDTSPYGNNIAIDPDFPSAFSSGDGQVGLIGVGYAFNEQFRVEARLGNRKGEFNETKFGVGARAGEEYRVNGEISSTTLTVESFYDFTFSEKIMPYVKAGIGLAQNDYSARLGGAGIAAFDAADGAVDGYYDLYADETSTSFTWNVGLGVNVPVSDSVSVIAEYQYISLGDASTGADSFTDGFQIDGAEATELMVGLRFNF